MPHDRQVSAKKLKYVKFYEMNLVARSLLMQNINYLKKLLHRVDSVLAHE